MAPIDLPAARERSAVPRPLRWSALALPVALLDGATILASALLVGRLYYTAAFGNAGSLAGHLGWGASIGLIFIAIATMRGDYRFDRYLAAPSRPAGLWLSWTIAFAAVLALMFLLKSSEEMSRGATLLLYDVGLGILVAQRFAMARLLDGLRRNGHLASGRWLIIGHDDAIAACLAGFPPGAR